MAEATPTYDLMLLLSMGVEDERRVKILSDVEASISKAGGSIVHNGDWGTRPMTYRIQHQAEAEYHLLQFTGPTALLDTLRHSLGITDGVLRSRIIKVLPGTPPPPTPTPVAVHAPARAAPEPVEPAEVEPAPAAAAVEPEGPSQSEAPAEPEASAAAETPAAPAPTEADAPGEAEAPAEPEAPEASTEPSDETAE